MPIFKFYGVSDDLFVYEKNNNVVDEINCYDEAAIYKLSNGSEGLLIVGQYSPNGVACWSVGICPLDENVPIPNWPMTWNITDRGYSTLLTIEVPAGTQCEALIEEN